MLIWPRDAAGNTHRRHKERFFKNQSDMIKKASLLILTGDMEKVSQKAEMRIYEVAAAAS